MRTRFSFHEGFLLDHRTQTLSLDQAVAFLSTKKQHHYTEAIRLGDLCILTHDMVRCPHCGKYSYAYAHDIRPQFCRNPRIPKEEIHAWATNMSLFPEDNELVLQEVWDIDVFPCPHCHRESTESTTVSEVEIQVEEGTVRFVVYKADRKDIAQLLFNASQKGIPVRFPLRETVTFAKYRSWIDISDEEGHILMTRDTTEPNHHWFCSVTFRLLSDYSMARRKLAQAFELVWGGPLPMTRAELADPCIFLSLNRFRGFSRSFYYALPVDGNGIINRSFHRVASQLRNANRLPSLLEESGLPAKKSIRRLLFQHQELVWFLAEAKKLGEILGDVNLLSSFLGHPAAYEVLLFLHTFPAADCYFQDYAQVRGPKALLSICLRFDALERLKEAAIRYGAGSPAFRRSERARWKKGTSSLPIASTAIPLQASAGIQNRDVDIHGYRFLWLKSRAQFQWAGRALANCLVHQGPETMRVAAALERGTPVAAIEVKGGQIFQALGPGNAVLDRSGGLWRAISAWSELLHLPFAEPEDDDELLPF